MRSLLQSAGMLALLLVHSSALAEPPARDRIVMNSGESLLGDLTRIHEGDLFFDSEELEELELDFGDIAEIHSPRIHTYRFVGRRIYSGRATMVGESVTIETAAEPITLPRNQLVAMQEGDPRERNYWSGMANVGLSLSKGNTNQSDFTTVTKLTRRTALTRLEGSYNGSMSTQDGDSTGSTHRGLVSFDYFMTSRFYVTIPAVEVYSDRFQNVSLRVTPSAGLGYDLLVKRWIDWDVGVGAGYQYSKAKSAAPGQSRTQGDVAAIFATGIDLDPTDNIEWDTDYKLQLIPTDFDKTNHHLLSVVSVELFGPIDLDVSFTFDRTRNPPLKSDGTQPESNDYRLSLGLGVDF